MLVDPLEHGHAQVRPVGVAARADVIVHQIRFVVHLVEPPQPGDDAAVAVHREQRVRVGVGEQQRPRRHEGGDGRPLPFVGVVEQHAVAMVIDDLLGDVTFQIAHAADRDGALHALVGRRDPERGRAAAGDAGHADPIRVHVGPAHEIIDRSDAVPALDAGRGVAGRVPPPAAEVVGAVVFALDFAQLQRVDDQADVAVGREPHPLVLVRRLVAVAAAVGVAADVQDRRQLALDLLRPEEVAGDVQPRPALEVQLFDRHVAALQRPGHGRVERRLLRQRPQAEHVEVLLTKLRQTRLPFGPRRRPVEDALGQFRRFLLQIGVDHRVAGLHGGFVGARPGGQRQEHGRRRPEEQQSHTSAHEHYSLGSGAGWRSPMTPLGLRGSQKTRAATCMAAKRRSVGVQSLPKWALSRGTTAVKA